MTSQPAVRVWLATGCLVEGGVGGKRRMRMSGSCDGHPSFLFTIAIWCLHLTPHRGRASLSSRHNT